MTAQPNLDKTAAVEVVQRTEREDKTGAKPTMAERLSRADVIINERAWSRLRDDVLRTTAGEAGEVTVENGGDCKTE